MLTSKQARMLAERYERVAMQLEGDRVNYCEDPRDLELRNKFYGAFYALRKLTAELAYRDREKSSG